MIYSFLLILVLDAGTVGSSQIITENFTTKDNCERALRSVLNSGFPRQRLSGYGCYKK
jgi:hypothetical protein